MSEARRLLGYVLRERAMFAGACACMVLLALATGAYAFLIGPAIKLLVSGGAEGMGRAFAAFPALAKLDRAQALMVMPALILAVALVKGAAYFGHFYLMGMLGQRVSVALRRDFFAAALAKSPAFFGRARTGDLLARFTADVAQVERAVTYSLASYVRDTLSVVVLLALCLYLDWRLSLVAFVGIPLVVLPVAKLAKKLKRRSTDSQQALGRLIGLVQEGLWGVRVIQAYRMEAREAARFQAENARLLRAETRAAKARSLAPAVLEIASVVGLAAALKLAGEAVTGGTADPEKLVSFLAAVAMVYQPAKDLGRVGQFAIQAMVGGRRLFEVIDAPPGVAQAPGAAPLAPLQRELRLDSVSFGYGERLVLDRFDLNLTKGEVVALVGESGAGKSTAALLAMRFADPARGSVLVDGRDVRGATLSSVRRQYGLVTQEPLLFSGTVAENIAYGRKGATAAEIEQAATVADADAFIRALPQGYQTRIGERGVRLSGGQKQRIALARALLAEAPVLLLDEATSNLDAQSELEVAAALSRAMRNRTVLLIAHRLSTVRQADRIVVLRGGRIVEQGTHEELLARGGEYARLYQGEGAHPTA